MLEAVPLPSPFIAQIEILYDRPFVKRDTELGIVNEVAVAAELIEGLHAIKAVPFKEYA